MNYIQCINFIFMCLHLHCVIGGSEPNFLYVTMYMKSVTWRSGVNVMTNSTRQTFKIFHMNMWQVSHLNYSPFSPFSFPKFPKRSPFLPIQSVTGKATSSVHIASSRLARCCHLDCTLLKCQHAHHFLGVNKHSFS